MIEAGIMDKFDIVCTLIAIRQYAKDIGYSLKGKSFYGDWLLTERLSDEYEKDILETLYLGESKDAPTSKEIDSRVARLLPEKGENADQSLKLLRNLIVNALVGIEAYKPVTMAESSIIGEVAHILQRHNGLLYRRLTYSPKEIANDKWITVHPNKENPEDYRRLKVEDGETSKEAVERKFGKDKKEPEKKETAVKEEVKKEEKREFVPFKTEDGRVGSDGKSVSYSKGYQTIMFDLPDIKEAKDFEKDELYERTLESMDKPASDETEKDIKQRYYQDILQYVSDNAGIESQEQYFQNKLKKAKEFAEKGEVAGVKKQKPMSFQEADSGSVNPKYVDRTSAEFSALSEDEKKEALEYVKNCQTCVFAFEMRSRGYNIEAKGNTKADDDMCRRLSAETRKAYVDPETGRLPKNLGEWEEINTDKRLIKFMDKTVKQGERYNLAVQWKYGSGHIVSVMRGDDGELMMYDPQTNKKYNKETILSEFLMRGGKSVTQYKYKTYWGDVKTPPEFYRVDNTLINPVYADTVLKGK